MAAVLESVLCCGVASGKPLVLWCTCACQLYCALALPWAVPVHLLLGWGEYYIFVDATGATGAFAAWVG